VILNKLLNSKKRYRAYWPVSNLEESIQTSTHVPILNPDHYTIDHSDTFQKRLSIVSKKWKGKKASNRLSMSEFSNLAKRKVTVWWKRWEDNDYPAGQIYTEEDWSYPRVFNSHLYDSHTLKKAWYLHRYLILCIYISDMGNELYSCNPLLHI
jgi:hypothetical protein